MSSILLRDDQWEKIYTFLKDHPRAYAGEEAECRLFVRRPAQAEIWRFLMKVLSWIIALFGLWEFGDIVLPFIIGFSNVQAFVWNHITVGIILVIVGAWAGLASNIGTAKTMNWIATVAGVWLIIASFILGNPVISVGLWNDIIVGVFVLTLGVWAALTSPRVAG